MTEITQKIIFSRHARRRMKLYRISEEQVETVLLEGQQENNSPDRFSYVKDMPGFQYPLKVIVQKKEDASTVITAYPLKRKETKNEGIV